jgi:ribosomal protein S12 methylthiotransferase
MLARMQRRTTEAVTRELLGKLRAAVPEIVLRTTFIVGHPGETGEHFASLVRFVEEMEFDRVGVFRYSPEEGTKSERQPGTVSALVKAERYHTLMELQKGVSRRRHEALIGRTVDVLVEGLSEESELVLQGRTQGQAPDIDGVTYIGHGEVPLEVGSIVPVRIVDAGDYDLVAQPLDTADDLD